MGSILPFDVVQSRIGLFPARSGAEARQRVEQTVQIILRLERCSLVAVERARRAERPLALVGRVA